MSLDAKQVKNEELRAQELATTIRILDVNANRAAEGLRVVEEHLRFALQDSLLCTACKAIRHEVSRTVAQLVTPESRAACRSTETDVGTAVQTVSEYLRDGSSGIALANIKRVTESLRVLEEYAKLFCGEAAKQFEALRYRTYSLEKSLGHLVRARRGIGDAQLYVLIDGSYGFGDTFRKRFDSLLKSEVDVVQLRAKDANERDLISCARELSSLCIAAGKLFVVNDRPDIAKVTCAQGLHLGQSEMNVVDARSVVGPDTLIGVSTHSLLQAEEAVREGADYLGVGPIYPSQTKEFSTHVGVELVQQIKQEIELPYFAIGGIDEVRLAEVMAAGASRVAVSHAIWRADSPFDVANRMKQQLMQNS